MISNPFESNLVGWLMRKTSSSAVRRVADLPIAVASNVGLVREENQDRAAIFRFSDYAGKQYLLAVLCDGMGGMNDGAICAAEAVAFFVRSVLQNVNKIHPEHCLELAAMYANERIFEQYFGKGGATLSATLCMSHRSEIYWVNIGDSRIYKYGSKYLQQLTVDDTVAGQLAREPNEYQGRNELLQFVGVGPVAEPHVGRDIDVSDSGVYLLSSDGVHFLPARILHQINLNASEPAIAARRMTDLAMWCGGHDNASIIVGEFSSEILNAVPGIQADCLEVWDSFGDARFFGIRRLVYDLSQRDRKNYLVSREEDSIASEKNKKLPSEVSVEKNSQVVAGSASKDPELELKSQIVDAKTSTRIPSRKRRTTKKISADAKLQEISPDPLSQLKINFRRKE